MIVNIYLFLVPNSTELVKLRWSLRKNSSFLTCSQVKCQANPSLSLPSLSNSEYCCLLVKLSLFSTIKIHPDAVQSQKKRWCFYFAEFIQTVFDPIISETSLGSVNSCPIYLQFYSVAREV